MAMEREMRRKDRLVNEERTREIIEKSGYGVLITADKEGNPYGVAVSPVLDGNALYIHCAREGRKLDHIKENPKVCLNFVASRFTEGENFTERYESAIVEGTATIVEEEGEKLQALRLICGRYTDHTKEKIEEYILPQVKNTGVIRVDIKSISGKINEQK